MYGADTTYDKYGSRTEVGVPPITAGGYTGGNTDNDRLLQLLIQRRLQKAIGGDQRPLPGTKVGVGAMATVGSPARMERFHEDPHDVQMRMSGDSVRLARDAAMTSPQPRRYSHVGTSGMALTPDVQQFSGVQREVFLPNGASAAPGGADTLLDHTRAGGDAASWQQRMDNDRARSQEYGSGADPSAGRTTARPPSSAAARKQALADLKAELGIA